MSPASRRAAPSHAPSAAPLAARLYAQLAHGGFVSGTQLAQRLRVSRSAVWKAAGALRGLGVVVHAVRNRGYRLPTYCAPLEAARVRALLAAEAARRVRRLEAVWSLDSTNRALLERTDLPSGLADVMLAEYQTAGRGRRGRAWLAPPGGAICLSLSWSFPQVPRDLGALGLAVGVCALRALRRHTAADLRLKWPNDLMLEERKLAGILIEMRAESAGPTYVVIGIGINMALGTAAQKRIAATGTEAIDLKSAGVEPGARDAVIADLIAAILSGLLAFEQHGLRPFAEEWKQADCLRGRIVNVHASEGDTRGLARGIDLGGALLVETERGVQKFVSGDVTVRRDA
jgi:BirA family biotin operon repressor/biotin-[acetyl-CoA-carboxylase] ligase